MTAEEEKMACSLRGAAALSNVNGTAHVLGL